MKGFKGSTGPKGHSGVRGDPVSLSRVFIAHFLKSKQLDMIRILGLNMNLCLRYRAHQD